MTVGLPVYNGADYLAEAVDSILRQSFRDLELVIADDRSSDRTGDICRHYAALDPRVRYHLNPVRLGLAENHNKVVELARGDYFHWTGADDSHHPDFLARCLEALAATPGSELAITDRVMIDENGKRLRTEADDREGAASASPARRLRAALFGFPRCSAMHGLVACELLRRTSLMLPFHASDKTFVVEAALLTPFAHVAAPLFYNRDHPARWSRNAVIGTWDRMLQSATSPESNDLPIWRGFASWWAAVGRFVPDRAERLRCYQCLGSWLLAPRSVPLLVADAACWASPEGVRQFIQLKRRLGIGPWLPPESVSGFVETLESGGGKRPDP